MAQKHPFPLNIIRGVFPILEKISPSYANNMAAKLFLTPVRFGFTEKEKEFLPKLKQYTLSQKGKKIMVYSMGEGPVVIGLHGWAGRGIQFRMFAEALAESGYKFITFDAWGHGQSEGKMSSLFEFSEGLDMILNQESNVKVVLAHSLGSAAASYYAAEKGTLPALVTFGAPVVAEDILSSFTDTINASKKIHAGIRQKAIERYNTTFDEVAMENTFKKVSCPVLGLHGLEDKDVPHTHLDVLKSIQPNMDARKYEGIGHRSILKNEKVIEEVMGWINNL
ncbi:MAG: alpha/beta hydrolase [Salibacteraceae bacterium]|nr:alpha/beta hydrolase [Salibacteraceae bacterium]